MSSASCIGLLAVCGGAMPLGSTSVTSPSSIRSSSTSLIFIEGAACHNSATSPATCGVAMLVPLMAR